MCQTTKNNNVKTTLLILFILTLLTGCGGGGGGGGADTTEPDSLTTLNSISISRLEGKIKAGNSRQLTVTAYYTDSSTTDVSTSVAWSSSQSNIANISTNGVLDASSAGQTSITAILDGKEDSIDVDVIDFSELSISPTALTLVKGSVQQYTATGQYSDNSTEDLSDKVSWNSSHPIFASISESGLLTTISQGTSTISANFDSYSSSTTLTVSLPELTLITINTPSLLTKGVSEQLSAVGLFSNGSTQDISSLVTWHSSDISVASIDETQGLLTPIQAGDVTITASTSSLRSSAVIEISAATLEEINITPADISLAKGSSTTVSIIAIFSDQSIVDISSQVDWENSNDTTVTLIPNDSNLSSTIFGNNVGSAVLTASFSGHEATLQVDVSDAILTELTISPENISLPLGLSHRFFANGIYSDGSVQDLSTQVTWASNEITLAAIDNSASLEGVAQGLAEGVASISATLGNITQSTNLNISTAQLSSIEIQPSKQTAAINFSIPIKAIGHYSDGSEFDITDIVEWSPNNYGILNFSDSKKGTIHTLHEGDTLINATLNNISGLGQVFVSSATLQSINISPASTTIPKGLQQQLQATGTFSDGVTSIITQQVTWQSDTPLVASINNTLGLLQTNST